ncbi:cytochrome P450 [Streptomyces sp. NPDC049936]|uniref:cytochrome P450 n=1 Tax=Streptomyces sp. NPDC049936 TaxID=3365599 RepID=UPI0037A6C503
MGRAERRGPANGNEGTVVVTPEFKAAAHEHYACLRSAGPVHPVRFASGVNGWVVVGYESAREALTHPALLKDPEPAAAALEAAGFTANLKGTGLGGQMLEADPPDHTRLRRLVSAAFSTGRTARLAPRIGQLANELVDRLPAMGETDLVEAFTAPLPVTVIAELLGVPEEYRADFRTWSNDVLALGTPRSAPALSGLRGMMDDLVDAKRRAPADDLLSSLIAIRSTEDGRLSDDELVTTAILLVIAGHETTTNFLGNSVLALLRHPEQLRLLRERPDLMPGAVEELLRYDSSVETTTFRYTAEDVAVGGTLIPRGSVVAVALASANRDAPMEPGHEPAELDVTRRKARHLAFGHGIHHCLGAPLARLETVVALDTLVRRMRRMELAVPSEQVAWIPGGMMRGPLRIPLRFEKSAS